MPWDAPRWKENWKQVQRHYQKWWKREGAVLTLSGLATLDEPRDRLSLPPRPATAAARHTDPEWFALRQRESLSRDRFPADNLPMAHTDYGCVQLAACFGAEPEFADDTVWYAECVEDPQRCPPLVLTKTEPWWQNYKRVMQKVCEVSQGDFLVGMPAFGSNLDVLAGPTCRW